MAYAGYCKRCATVHELPRTPEAEQAARALLGELDARPAPDRGKMVGVLLALDAAGRTLVLRAYSGRLSGGNADIDWVPPVPERDHTDDEARTFGHLETINEALKRHLAHPVVVAVREIESAHEAQLKALNARLQRARDSRQRGLDPVETTPGPNARRQLKAARQAALEPHRVEYASVMREVEALRTERKSRSQALHTQMRDALRLPNPAGRSPALASAHDSKEPLRGGAGQCCAPKLLVEATRRGLQPVAMAECWWGPDSGDGWRRAGEFYGPCERCQPLLGHLLCDGGLRIVYRDAHLIAVDKPAGVPSVPGRDLEKQDSVQTRAQLRFPGAQAVHRLDVDTSGLLLIALDQTARSGLSRAFAQREVEKRYVALLERAPEQTEGEIELRTGPDPTAPPRHRLDPNGRPSRTRWQIQQGRRVQFAPHQGRTHQIRLAAKYGLGIPIEGDPLYGHPAPRLMLHAETLKLPHPITGQTLNLKSPAPF